MGLDDVLSDLEEIGYTARPVVVPACAVNAPHRRDRVWILGHANEQGPQRHRRHDERAGEWSVGAAGTDADTDRGRQQQRDEEGWQRLKKPFSITNTDSDGQQWHEAELGLGREDDGLPGRLADPRWRGDPMNAFGADWEDGVPRVVATERDRVNKLKALGNAIVPQVAYQILMAMVGE
jgi:DNA (cytosine-5)-methyltransferase 1